MSISKLRANRMNDPDLIFQQASIIEEQAECIKNLSDLAHDTIAMLAQYQSVEAEERRYKEIGEHRWKTQ